MLINSTFVEPLGYHFGDGFFWVVVPLVEFAYLDFFTCQGSYCRLFRSFLLWLCDAFRATPSFDFIKC